MSYVVIYLLKSYYHWTKYWWQHNLQPVSYKRFFQFNMYCSTFNVRQKLKKCFFFIVVGFPCHVITWHENPSWPPPNTISCYTIQYVISPIHSINSLIHSINSLIPYAMISMYTHLVKFTPMRTVFKTPLSKLKSVSKE